VKYGVKPDLTTLGKIIGGGLPIGAFLGRREIMEMVAPSGAVYQAGTFSGNPLSLAAGSATVQWLHDHRNVYSALEDKTRAVEENLSVSGGGSFVRLGSMFKYFFRNLPPRNYREVRECNTGPVCSRRASFSPRRSLRRTSCQWRTPIRIVKRSFPRIIHVVKSWYPGQQAGTCTG